jgi:hypothetical protein
MPCLCKGALPLRSSPSLPRRLQVQSLPLQSLLLRLLPLLLPLLPPLLLREHQLLPLLLVLPRLLQVMYFHLVLLQLPPLRLSRPKKLRTLLPEQLEQRS